MERSTRGVQRNMSRPQRVSTKMRTLRPRQCVITVATLLFISTTARAADDGFTPLLNGKDLAGWKFKNEAGAGAWKVVGSVKLDAADPKKLVGEGQPGAGGAVLLRGEFAHGSDVYTEAEAGDVELLVDVMVPKGSNSGVYLIGQYEVQVLDSFGKTELKPGDMGGIYNTKAPSVNASKAPGEWQTLHVVFRAPRFGADGKKAENAKFVLVELNGQKIHENVEAPKATGGELPGGEKAKGPLLFQGDHGIVAYRNVKWKAIELK
jgi:hypothetical protein